MKSFQPWMCHSRISACLLALVLIWTCSSVNAAIPCENNCLHTVNNQADCEVIGCRHGCKPGWYGSLCNKRCSRRCKDVICNQTDGKCMKGCKGRWLGSDNEIICKGSRRNGSRNRVQRGIVPANKRCLRKNVDNQKTCDCCISRYRGPNCAILCEYCETFEQPGLCKYMCNGGYYGDTCNMTCSENCATGIVGTHLCETTRDGTVQCSNGCIHGRYGKYCSYNCSQFCRNKTCYQNDGTCIGCSDNRYGSHCNMSCSGKCNDDRCQRNGTCIDGCEEGYSGLKCDQKCSVNCTEGLCYQNGMCKLKCGKNCLDSSCQAQTGNGKLTFVCTHGCEDGYMGSQCQELCPEHCTNCSKLPHFSSCKHTSGNPGGAEKGSSEPFHLLHVVVPIVLIIISVIIIILIVILCKKCGYFKRQETQTDENPEEDELLVDNLYVRVAISHADDKERQSKDTDIEEQSQVLKDDFKNPEDHTKLFPFAETRNIFEKNKANSFTDGYTNDRDKRQSSRPVERSKSEAKCRELNTKPTVKNVNLTESGPSDKPDAKRDENTDTDIEEQSQVLKDDFKNPEDHTKLFPFTETRNIFEKNQANSFTDGYTNDRDKRQSSRPVERSKSEAKCRELNTKPTVRNVNLTESGPSDKPDAKRDENTDVLDAPSEETNQLLDQACRNGDLGTVQRIISHDIVDKDGRDEDGQTLLMSAAENGNREVFDFLLSNGWDPMAKDKDKNTVLNISCNNDNAEFVKYLLTLNRFDIDVKGSLERTPVMIAALNGCKRVFDLLMKEGCDLSAVDDEGNTIMNLACFNDNADFVKYLLALKQFDIDVKGYKGRTPVMNAARNGCKNVVKLLVNEHCDLSAVDVYNNNITDIANVEDKEFENYIRSLKEKDT